MTLYLVLGFIILVFSFSVLSYLVTLSFQRKLTGYGPLVYCARRSNTAVTAFTPEHNEDVTLYIYNNGRTTFATNGTEYPLGLTHKQATRLHRYCVAFSQDYKS